MTDILAIDRTFRCPICDRRFVDHQALTAHATKTKQHEDIFEHVWRQRFLLAEAEDRIKFWLSARGNR
jgi:hypothetical protein